MAMSKDTMGQAIWDAIKASTGATYSPEGDAQGLAIWKTTCEALINHIKVNADIAIPALNVSHVLIAPPGGGPVTGTASVDATTISGKIS